MHTPIHALVIVSTLPFRPYAQCMVGVMRREWHVWAQVTVLDVLDQEGALHLLPSVQKAPSLEHGEDEKDLFMDTKPPAEVLRVYRRLLDEGSLDKAAELGSLPHSIATKWA